MMIGTYVVLYSTVLDCANRRCVCRQASPVLLTRYGWRVQAALAIGCELATGFGLLLRGPHEQRYTLYGWTGGSRMTVQREQSSSSDGDKESQEMKREASKGSGAKL